MRNQFNQPMLSLLYASIVLLLGFSLTVGVLAKDNAGREQEMEKKETTQQAEKPHLIGKQKEQVVYRLVLFTGITYESTFCPQEVQTIYMIAGTDNTFGAAKTQVYFWPITREYMANWMEMDQDVDGTLEILAGPRSVKTLEKVKCCLEFPQGYASGRAILHVGNKADEVFGEYGARTVAFYNALTEYYRRQQEYADAVNQLLTNPKSSRREPVLEAPTPPAEPVGYVTEPQPAFIVNLPAGDYKVRLRDGSGRVVPGTTRRLVSFAARRGGVGYQIIPADEWTYPTESNTPGETILAASGQEIYLKPFQAREYNAHCFARLRNLPVPSSGRGEENRWIWVHLDPIECKAHRLEILRGNKVIRVVEEKPYYVKQKPGYSLGYDIVEFDQNEMEGRSPSFTAYKVELPKQGSHVLRFVDEDGVVIPGSTRNVRTVTDPGLTSLVLSSLLPLVFGIGAILARRVRFDRPKQPTAWRLL